MATKQRSNDVIKNYKFNKFREFLRRDSERLGEPRGGGWGWLVLCPTERPMGMIDTPLEPS